MGQFLVGKEEGREEGRKSRGTDGLVKCVKSAMQPKVCITVNDFQYILKEKQDEELVCL